MSYELHEKILLYLFELRHTDETHDLLIKFEGTPKRLIYSKTEELKKKGFIEVEYPFAGIGSLDWNTGRLDFPNAESEYLKAKIRNEGIEFVKTKILKRTDWLEVAYKFFAIIGVLGTLFFGIRSWQQADKTSDLEKSNKSVLSDNDSLVQRAKSADSIVNAQGRQIKKLILQRDSFTNKNAEHDSSRMVKKK
jgi:hypothetical protein